MPQPISLIHLSGVTKFSRYVIAADKLAGAERATAPRARRSPSTGPGGAVDCSHGHGPWCHGTPPAHFVRPRVTRFRRAGDVSPLSVAPRRFPRPARHTHPLARQPAILLAAPVIRWSPAFRRSEPQFPTPTSFASLPAPPLVPAFRS